MSRADVSPRAAAADNPGPARRTPRPTANFQTNKAAPADPSEWLAGAETHQGSRWPDFVTWLTDHGGATHPAPDPLGGGGLVPLFAAPGSYVFGS